MPFEHGGETGVDRLRERHALPCRRRPPDADERCDGGRRARRERADDVLRAAELRPLRRRQRALADARTDRKVLLGQLLPAPTARRHEPAARREQRVARVVGPDLRARPVRGLQVRARVTEVAHGRRCSTAGDRCSRTHSPSSREVSSTEAGRSPSTRSTASSGRPWSDCSTNAFGVGTLIPRPLPSQTKSSGSGGPSYARKDVALSAACAVAWFSDASPNEHTTIASSAHADSTPRRRALDRERHPHCRGGARRSSRSAE